MFQLKEINVTDTKIVNDIRFQYSEMKHITYSAYFIGSTESFFCYIVLYQPTSPSLSVFDSNYSTRSRIGEWRVRDFFEWNPYQQTRIQLTNLYSDLFFNQLVEQLSSAYKEKLA